MRLLRRANLVGGIALGLLSRPGRTTLRIVRRLAGDFGHTRSARLGRPVDPAGNAWPWYTYPAIAYLEQLDLRGRRVFEYGCGHSTIFWGGHARRVLSIDHDRAWIDRIAPGLPANCQLRHEAAETGYVGAIDGEAAPWDIVVVDGIWRPQCAARAIQRLAPGGFIVLDNSDWYPATAAVLRKAGLLEIDFSGFGPVNDYAWTTSLFLDRTFAAEPSGGRQPGVCRGGIDKIAE